MTNDINEPIDGSVFAYSVNPHDGIAYVTIAGSEPDSPMVIGFDLADLDALKRARKELRSEIAKFQPRRIRRAVSG